MTNLQTAKTKIPIDFRFRAVVMTLVASAFVVATLVGESNLWSRHNIVTFSSVALFLIALQLFDLYLRKSYSILYDDSGVNWQKVGLSRSPRNQIRITYSDVASVEAISGSIGIAPFEALSINANNTESIILSRQHLFDDDIKNILMNIALTPHVVIDDDVISFYEL